MAFHFTDSHTQFLSIFFDMQRKRKYPLIDVINAIFLLVDSGMKWRQLSVVGIPYDTTYYYFKTWRDNGLWEEFLAALVALEREQNGRDSDPTACLIDSQSIKCDAFISDNVGFDGGKKIKGRKRTIVTDTEGNLLACGVDAANKHDGKLGVQLLAMLISKYPTLEYCWADSAYGGHFRKVAQKDYDLYVETVRGLKEPGFQVQPRRWKVEQTLAILGKFRRLAKDYEHTVASAVSVLNIAWILVLLPRLL